MRSKSTRTGVEHLAESSTLSVFIYPLFPRYVGPSGPSGPAWNSVRVNNIAVHRCDIFVWNSRLNTLENKRMGVDLIRIPVSAAVRTCCSLTGLVNKQHVLGNLDTASTGEIRREITFTGRIKKRLHYPDKAYPIA